MDPIDMDEQASYWADFEYLVSIDVIPMAQIPLKFSSTEKADMRKWLRKM